MPLVNVKIIEGVFREDQKQEMIERLTDTMVEKLDESEILATKQLAAN